MAEKPNDIVEDLRQSGELFRLLVEGVRDYAIFMLDPEGYIISWNPGAERFKGYRADEIIGQHFSQFYSAKEIERRWPWHELEVAKVEGRFENEGWRIRKDGTRFWANVVITALYSPEGKLRGFAKITRDMTERKRSEDLEDTARRMTEFLAILAHELRNPLASIRNAVTVMQERPVEDSDIRWSRDVVSRQVLHLARLVDDLLDVGRITSGKIILRTEPVDLSVVIQRAIEATEPVVHERGHILETVFPKETLRVQGDPIRLTQIVTNLLNNAAKYMERGGRILVFLEREGTEALIRIQDTGIGISPDLLSKVFDMFIQGDASLARSESGLGIGLTLVRRLAEMHSGTVEAFSAGSGRGSEFVVRLPLVREPVAPSKPAAPAEDKRPRRSDPRRLLVVDDNQDSATSMALLLQAWGHQVRTANDGISALAAAQEFSPEIVLLDIGLPGMSGYEVAERMRAMPGLAATKLITLTGYGDEAARKRAREAGCDLHLIKPVDPKALRELIQTLPDSAPKS